MLWKIQQRLVYLDKLLSQKSTGTPKELANKLGITERAWLKFKDELINDLYVPIMYNRKIKSYMYKENGKILMRFENYKK